MTPTERLHRDIARINRREMGQHWQNKVAFGHGPWQGDTNLVLKEFTDLVNAQEYIECWYEPPGDKTPELVLRKPAEDFDIDLFCLALYEADNRNVSVADKIRKVDEANALRQRAADNLFHELTEEAAMQLAFEIRRANHPGAPRKHHFSGVALR